LTTTPDCEPRTPGKQTRRSFTEEEKLAIVLEIEQHGATVSSVARKHGIVSSLLFRWRADLGFGKSKRAKLVSVALTDRGPSSSSAPLVLQNLLQMPEGMIVVELDDGRRVFAPDGSDPAAVRQHVAERETTR
jgi:transposase-like protein